MKIFTLENEINNITVHSTEKQAAEVVNAQTFRSEAALLQMAGEWPMTRLVEIWNSLPGEIPVKKFKDRTTAVSRIWKAIQSLEQFAAAVLEPEQPSELVLAGSEPVQAEATGTAAAEADALANVAPQTAHVAPAETAAGEKTTRPKKAPKTPKPATDGQPREGSKTSQVVAMLKREGGTTIEEIMTAMGWQKHTTRAMLSAGGSLTKNHGLTVLSEKVSDKRVYSIRG